MSRINERMFWEFADPQSKPDQHTHLEHAGITVEQAADFLIGQGRLKTRPCSCCGHPTPVNGTRVRMVRMWGNAVAHEGGEDKWVPASTVEGEWRTYPLSKKGGGN